MRCAFKGNTPWILSIDSSPNGRLLVSTSRDNAVRLWNMRDGTTQILTDNNSAVYAQPIYASAVFNPDGRYIAASNKDGVLRIWTARTGHLVRRVQAHTDWVYDVKFMPNGKGLISGGKDATLKYWNLGSLDPRMRRATGVTERIQPERQFVGHNVRCSLLSC